MRLMQDGRYTQGSVAATQSSTFSHLPALGPLTSARAQLFFFGFFFFCFFFWKAHRHRLQSLAPKASSRRKAGVPHGHSLCSPPPTEPSPFLQNQKTPRRSSQNLSVTLIFNPCSTSEGGTRPGTHAPTEKRHCHHSWPA